MSWFTKKNKKKEILDINITVDNDGNISVDYPTDSSVRLNIIVNGEQTYDTPIIDRTTGAMKFSIPVGDLSVEDAEKSLQEFMSSYSKPVKINHNGDITVNGKKHKPYIPFTKEIFFGTRIDGNSPEIETI